NKVLSKSNVLPEDNFSRLSLALKRTISLTCSPSGSITFNICPVFILKAVPVCFSIIFMSILTISIDLDKRLFITVGRGTSSFFQLYARYIVALLILYHDL